jgi:beta-lactamase superfamily II metal-dependent hydrolase/DNA/RNA endonuclease YhcR with UshA esterase domain
MKVRYLLASLCFALLAATPAAASFLRVYYPDIEQGAATLVVAPNGHALLVDGGSGIKTSDEAIENMINDLIAAGVVTSLDYVVVSHYDEDHIGRLDAVFQNVPIAGGGIVYDRGTYLSTPGTFAYSDYAYGASFHNRTTVPVCTSINLGGGVTARVTTVNGEVCGNGSVDITSADQFENNTSVTVVVTYGNFDLWIGGDLTGNPLEGVADVETPTGPQAGDVDVYTFNHHGSETSSNASFLGDLAAEVGINQSSITNDFGHPRINVVNRFLGTPDTNSNVPLVIQQNPSAPGDVRSDDGLADYIADCDDSGAATVFGHPGTILLISDGDSYRIHACNIPAFTLPADAGPGTPGDFPPAIRVVDRAPWVPLASENAAISADIEGATSARIEWELNGVAQTDVTLTNTTGITWTGTIPMQSNGARVFYRVAAEDGVNATELSAGFGYFSGTTPISTLRSNNGDGVLNYLTYGVRVEGSITAEPGLFHATVTQAFVQDGTGGVQIFDNSLLSLNRGDVVEFRGEAAQFGGATEISIAEPWGNFGYTYVSSGSPPSAQVLTVSAIGEAAEGELVRINGVSIVSGSIPESGGGNITVSDNGGVNTITLRVDDATDIPGANTPTTSFDILGIVNQFDSWVPLNSGFQIQPREKADFISTEVNHPQVIIAEIHADPAGDSSGDANGDGTRDAEDDEFVELINTGYTAIDIGGWTLHDAVGLKHTFTSGTILPPREATVVFGAGTPTGAFGNAAANSLVFVASAGTLGLNNTGDTVTLKDNTATVVQAYTYGSEANDDKSLTRPDYLNSAFVKHPLAPNSGGTKHSPGARTDHRGYTVPKGSVLLSEVLYDPSGADGGLEWIELWNSTGSSIDLSELCLANGGTSYNPVLQLTGSIGAGATRVVGGPTSSATNNNPTLGQAEEFSPNLQNSGSPGDGVALYNMRCARVTASTVPIDAVVYGNNNNSNLIDETGSANSPEVGDAPQGQSIQRTSVAGAWSILTTPSPNSTPLP